MGPTLFLPATHTAEAHAAFFTYDNFELAFDSADDDDDADGAAGKEEDDELEAKRCAALLETWSAWRADLGTGDVSLFDSRCLHAGAANSSPRPRVLSAELQLLETALGEPVDTHGAVTVLLKLVQRRLDAAEEAAAAQQRSAERRAEAELCRMSAAMHESVRVIREQVQLEQAATESALQERELQILKLNLQEGVTTLES